MAAREDGTNVPHEKLSGEIVVQQPGYAYIYFSNDNGQPLEVFFDDFTVTHVHSAIVQADDYYPFGMTFNVSEREGSLSNKYLFNGKEREEITGWDDFGARMYMADIGRWGVLDPSIEKYESISPYTYAFNIPIRFIDIQGKDPGDVVVIFAGGDLLSNRGLGSTGAIVNRLQDQFFNERGGAIRNFHSEYWSSRTWTGYYGPVMGISNTLTEGQLDKATQEAYDYILENYAEGGRVVLYGYSYGGVLASHLEKRLAEDKIKVNLLVTVDAAAGPQSDQLEQVVSNNTEENLNIYQTTPSSIGSKDDKNTREDGSEHKISNKIRVTYVDENGKKKKMTHSTIDEQTADEVIQSILERLK